MGGGDELIYGVNFGSIGELDYDRKIAISLNPVTTTNENNTSFTAPANGVVSLYSGGSPKRGARIERVGYGTGFVFFDFPYSVDSFHTIEVNKGETVKFVYSGTNCTANFKPYKHSRN